MAKLPAEKVTPQGRAASEKSGRGSSASRNAVITTNARGVIVSFNESAEAMFGRPAASVLGKPLTLLMPERFRDAHRAGISRFVRTGESRVVGRTVELAGLRADGTEFPLELTLASLSSGEDIVITGVIRDITERVELDEARRRLNDLQDLVISVLGHDLKVPIAAIQGYLELAMVGVASLPEGQGRETATRSIGKASEVAAGMLVTLGTARAISRLTMVGGGPSRKEPVDAAALVRQAVDSLRPLCEARRHTVAIDAPEQLMATLPPAFDSVVCNLLSNAIKYTPEAGEIRVRLSASTEGLRLEVEDTGPGIPPAQRPLLFRKFERLTKEQSVGSHGLGLSIAASIVALGKGTISAHDRADGRPGTVFRVELPS